MTYTGKWVFNEVSEKFELQKYKKIGDENKKLQRFSSFEDEEVKNYDKSYYEDIGTISIDTIKKQVLKYVCCNLKQKSIFQEFSKNAQINKFLKYLTIYMDQFLKTVEFLLIKKDMKFESAGLVKNLKSIEIEQKISDMLSHKRLLLAREFSQIQIGQINVSKSFKDKNINGFLSFEAFLQFCTFFLFLAFHRRGLNTIRYEIDRLFRSSHFTTRPMLKGMPRYSLREQQILYGRHNPTEKSYYFTNSPLISEVLKVSKHNKALLWIGDLKYMGPSEYMHNLEKLCITSDTQLNMIHENIGILGHPKALYDSHLNRNTPKIRKEKFDDEYDVYGLVKRDCLKIPKGRLSLAGNRTNMPKFKIKYKKTYDSTKTKFYN